MSVRSFLLALIMLCGLAAGVHAPQRSLAAQEADAESTSSSALNVVNSAGSFREVTGLNPWSIPNRQVVLGYSPKGKYALTSGTSEVCVWDGASGSLVWALRTRSLAQEHRQRRFQFSLDETKLLLQVGQEWKLWDLTTGRAIFNDLLKDCRGGQASFTEEDEELAHIGTNASQPGLKDGQAHLTLIDVKKQKLIRVNEVERPAGPMHMIRDKGIAVIYSTQPAYEWQNDSRGQFREFGFTQIDLGKSRTARERMVKVLARDFPGIDGVGEMIPCRTGSLALIPQGSTKTGIRGHIFDLSKPSIERSVDLTPFESELVESGAWHEEITWAFPHELHLVALTEVYNLPIDAVSGKATGIHKIDAKRVDVRHEERWLQTRHMTWDPARSLMAETQPVLEGAMDPNITHSDHAPHEMSYFRADGTFLGWREVTPATSSVTPAFPEHFDWMKVSPDGRYAVSWSRKIASQFVVRALDGSGQVRRPKPWPERDGWMNELQPECPTSIDPHRGVLLISPGQHHEKLGKQPVAIELATGRPAPAIYTPPEDGTIQPLAWEKGQQRGLIKQSGLLMIWDYQLGQQAKAFNGLWSAQDTLATANGASVVLVYPSMEDTTRVVLADAKSGEQRSQVNAKTAISRALAVDYEGESLLALRTEGDSLHVLCINLNDGSVRFDMPVPQAERVVSEHPVQAFGLAEGTRFALRLSPSLVFVLDGKSGEFLKRFDFAPDPTSEMSPGIYVQHAALAATAGKLVVYTDRGRFLAYDLLR